MRWRPSQVAPALEAVRKDLSAAGMQAKAELERLQAQAAEARAAGNSSSDFASLAMNDAGLGSVGLAPSSSPSLFTPAPTTSAQTSTDQDLDEENPLTAEEKGKGREIQPETTPQQQSLLSPFPRIVPVHTLLSCFLQPKPQPRHPCPSPDPHFQLPEASIRSSLLRRREASRRVPQKVRGPISRGGYLPPRRRQDHPA
jgi:hypothetical protein